MSVVASPIAQGKNRAIIRKVHPFVTGAVTVGLLIFAFSLTRENLSDIFATGRGVSWATLVVVLLLLIAGAMLAVVRLRMISVEVGVPLGFRDAMLALSLGQIAGSISVQFFGQIAARSALFGRRGISNSVNIAMAAYERVAAVIVSAGMATFGALYLLGQVSFDLQNGGAQFLTIICGITCVILIGALTVWGRHALPLFKIVMTRHVAIAVAKNSFITCAIQLCTAGAYVVIARSLSDKIPISQLFSASLVVMFAASLPISFSGWGIREISTIFVLSAIGMPVSAALMIALVIGTMALVSVIVIAAIAVTAPAKQDTLQIYDRAPSFDVGSFVKWVLPIAAATLVFFQLYVPTGGGDLSINLADPIAVLGAIVFASEYGRNAQWRLPALPLFVGLASAILLLAYANGYFAFGSNHWASINRMLGWMVLLCYGATGSLIVAHSDEKGVALVARTFVATACAIVIFWSAIIFVNRLGVIFPKGVLVQPLAGFSQNRNAFSFGLLMAFCTLPLIDRRHRPASLAILAFGLWLAGSHAAFGTFVVIAGLSVYYRVISWRGVTGAVLAVTLIILFFEWAPTGLFSFVGADQTFPVSPAFDTRESSNIERLMSIRSGLTLFLSHPLFGAGLGKFIEAQTAVGVPLVIHSTPVWLLAETGLFGFAAFVAPAIWLFLRESRGRNSDPRSQLILLVLAAFGIMSQAHELLYQRPLWLLLGLTLFIESSVNKKRDNDQVVPATSGAI